MEGMAAGLYEELFAAVVSLINRYGAAGVREVMAPSWGAAGEQPLPGSLWRGTEQAAAAAAQRMI